MIIYLIHLDRPYKHAQHYIGITGDLSRRIKKHKDGNGNPLLRAANNANISWKVVRTWKDRDRAMERRLKKQHKTKMLCPICNPEHWMNREKNT